MRLKLRALALVLRLFALTFAATHHAQAQGYIRVTACGDPKPPAGAGNGYMDVNGNICVGATAASLPLPTGAATAANQTAPIPAQAKHHGQYWQRWNSYHVVSPIIINDCTNYYLGSYTGYLAPFSASCAPPANASELTPSTMTIADPSLFPNGVTIAWNYAGVPGCASIGVCGFLAIDYGNYAGDAVQTPITSLQVDNLTTMTETHNVTFGGTLDAYDAIDDLFLYSDPAQSVRDEEFIIVLHTNTQMANFVAAAPTQYGTTTISGILWKVACYCAQSTPIILFMPNSQADVASGTVDLKAMFAFAKAHGAITGSEWFTGMGIGAEPVSNGGTMTVNSFSATSN
jgi:hypothetical protein